MDSIKHTFYINLESRKDRKNLVEKELTLLGITPNRFNAIQLENGAIGCSMSHLKCLEIAKQNNWEHVLIVEDDIKFLDPKLFIKQFNKVWNIRNFDVLLIAGNNVPPYVKIDESCVKVTRCQTTTGYIVMNHYFDTLIQNIREGIGKLMREPSKHIFYAIDKYWFHLQQRDRWLLITPLTVTQREGYSDIEKRNTNYERALTDLDKADLLRSHQEFLLTKKQHSIFSNARNV
jgi:glycosyl transferase family 25